MYEILKKLGLPDETWLLSLFTAALAVMYRILEPEKPLSARKASSVALMGVFSGVLVPGLLDHVLNMKNPFWISAVTGLTVYCFEPLLLTYKKHILNNAKNGTF